MEDQHGKLVSVGRALVQPGLTDSAALLLREDS